MMRWLRERLAWLVAGRELAELGRWRVEWSETRRWLAEFDDAADALDHLDRIANGRHHDGLMALRDRMRKRRDHMRKLDDALATLRWSPGVGVSEFTREWRMASATAPMVELRSASLADLEAAAATDWDVARHMEEAIERFAFVDPPAPTHYEGVLIRS